jgi:type 1 fimbria pilin
MKLSQGGSSMRSAVNLQGGLLSVSKFLLFASPLLLWSAMASAAPTFVVGTPSFNGNNSVSPKLGGININFDEAATLTNVINSGGSFALPSNYYASRGVASLSDPSGLFVRPFSTQSDPNFVTNGNASINGEANITILLTNPTSAIGIGISDADGAPITLNLLGANGILATQIVTTPTNTINPFNGYYAFFDTSGDIFGISIVQAANLSSGFPSGLAIDDLQTAPVPEPVSTAMIGLGVLLIGCSRRWKRA